MVSLRFPFSFPHHLPKPPKPNNTTKPFSFGAVAAATSVGIGVGISIYLNSTNPTNPFGFDPSLSKPPIWASLSLSDGPTSAAVEPKTGVSFPAVLEETRRLLGVGLRKKSVFGLKNIDVYAFGVYADDRDVKKLSEKYGSLSDSQLKGNKELITDVLDQDIRMTVRLQIVYGRLSIHSVRSTFEESVGSRLLKFSGTDNKELLQRFTSIFKDEYKIPRGSVIELSKEQGFVLQTKLDGKEVGSIQSKLLCQSIFDIYIGDNSIDKRAKEDCELGLASLLKN